jgi:hypothetical protein
VLAVALLAGLAGCGGDDDPPDADPSGSPTPSESSSPTIEPATGTQIRSLSFKLRAPEGWKVKEGQTGDLLTTRYASEELSDGRLKAFFYTADGRAVLNETLPQLANKKVRSSEFTKRPEILDNLVVGGVEMYHVAGPVGRGERVIAAGTIWDDYLVELQIKSSMLSESDLQAALDSILATWTWT